MKKLNGIEGSSGIAVGKVFLLEEPEIVINRKACDPEKELKIFEAAIVKTKKQLEDIRDIAAKKVGEEEAKVFDAHIQMLEDPMLVDAIEEKIKATKSADWSTQSAVEEIAEMFSSMDDEYMKERAADIKDVGKRILMNVLGLEMIDISKISEEVVIVSDDITPSQSAQMDKKFVKGFATNIGGRTSHAAIMARTLEIPAILALKKITDVARNGDDIILDGYTGDVYINPSKEVQKEYADKWKEIIDERNDRKQYNGKPAITLDGHRVEIEVNIGNPEDAKLAMQVKPDGSGLFRSEFLYMGKTTWPTEEEQYEQYKETAEVMNSTHDIVIRTLDIGGDKKLDYFTFPEEMNPFLGYRAIRLCLDKKDIFKTQLRAILRASAFGPISIMFPMITVIEELEDAKKILEIAKDELRKEKKAFNEDIKVGIMVETPIVAINAELFAQHCDFFSIGTNDLIQYSFAADRMSETITYLYQPYNPSLLKMFKCIIDGAHKHGIDVCMCGEVAGESKAIPLLVGLGLDKFSMSSTSVNKVKKIICKMNKSDCDELIEKALQAKTNKEVIKLSSKFLDNVGGIMYGKR